MMGFLSKLFGRPTTESSPSPEQAVIVSFVYGQSSLDELFALDEKLEAAVSQATVGEYDGHEIAVDRSDGSLYLYGPSADKLFQVVQPILEATPFMAGAVARLRYGPPEDGVKETEVEIGT